MNKFSKSLVAASVLAATFGSTAAMAELSANVGVTSNYIWRGMPQSGDAAAVSGGIDYAHDSGFYAGTWFSSLASADGNDQAPQYEHDIYLGFGGEVAGLSYDLGYIKYMYPIDDTVESDFDEVYGSIGYSYFTLGLAYTTSVEDGNDDDYKDIYTHVAFDYPIKDDLSFGALFGSYNYEDDTQEDLSHYQLSLTKSTDMGDLTFAYDKANDYNDDSSTVDEDGRISVSWGLGVDL